MNRLVLILILLLSFGCSSLEEVQFKTSVETSTKKIDNQKRIIYSIDDIGVYASNKFDGARLNGLKFGLKKKKRSMFNSTIQKILSIGIFLRLKQFPLVGNK